MSDSVRITGLSDQLCNQTWHSHLTLLLTRDSCIMPLLLMACLKKYILVLWLKNKNPIPHILPFFQFHLWISEGGYKVLFIYIFLCQPLVFPWQKWSFYWVKTIDLIKELNRGTLQFQTGSRFQEIPIDFNWEIDNYYSIIIFVRIHFSTSVH